jgi:glycosyltransferase involved in cell wall biosynthesis
MMMKALKNVQETFPDTRLLIVGDGPERGRLEALASELGLSSHIFITGFREDTHLFYGIMDMFLLTSFSEGTAMTLLEAMAAGLPCVVTNVGGNPEIVRDGETGFIIPSDDEEALVDKVCMLLRDKTLMAAMGNAGRKRFEENFTVAKMVKEYEKIYEDLTDSRKA